MTDCLFCNISSGKMNTSFLYEDEQIVAFNDINPKASTHILVVPKLHVESFNQVTFEHKELISHITLSLPKIAKSQGLNNGFRTIINTGPEGGQEINHLHYHILGGRLPAL